MVVQNYREGDNELWQFAVLPVDGHEYLAAVVGFTTKQEAKEKAILATIKWAEELIEELKNLGT